MSNPYFFLNTYRNIAKQVATKDDIEKHMKIHNKIRNKRFYESTKIHHKLKDKKIHIKQGEFVISFN